MGKMKAWAMDLEEEFMDKVSEVIGECETYDEFTGRMEKHLAKLKHLDLSEKHDMLGEAWSEYWSKFI